MRTSSFAQVFASLCLPLLLAGCGDSTSTVDQGGAPDMARVVDLTGQRSGIGATCQSNRGVRGTCAGDDQVCVPDGRHGFPGGYCWQDCGAAACPADAECVRLGSGFDRCFALCNTDADCRSGYACDDAKRCVPALGYYPGGSVRPGTKDGDACVATPPAAGAFEADQEVSALNGAQTSLAVDEAHRNVVVVWSSLYANSILAPKIGVATSDDGGKTFGPPLLLPTDGAVDFHSQHSAPSVAVDSTGTFYVAWVGQGGAPDDIYVARSNDGGVSFADVAVVTPRGESAADSLNYPSIAVGPAGTVYVAWTTALAGQRTVRVSRSTDGGATWSDPVSVTNEADKHEIARIATSSDGSVYVAWFENHLDASVDFDQFGKNKIGLQKLTADLNPVGAAVIVSGTDPVPMDVPALAVRGTNVFVAYTSGTGNGAWDIHVAASTNGGATMKAPVKVNGDASCATHLHPAAAVDAAGILHVVYDDNRSLYDKDLGLDGRVFHTKATAALGAGVLAFAADEVVSKDPYAFTTEAGGPDWLGDYIGVAATTAAHVYVSWADPRTNSTSQIFFTRSGF